MRQIQSMEKFRKVFKMDKVKIFTAGYTPEKQGGGHTFLRNFRKCFQDNLVDNPEGADIFFITGLSMLNKLSEIPNKKIVLRVDNILKNSCNRKIYPFEGDKVSMMEAMRIVSQKASLVVYQSQWAKDLLDDFLKPKKSMVILNSADESIFNPDGARIPTDKDVYLFSRSSNHDNKQWHKAYYYYIQAHKEKPNRELWITGRFSPENIPNSFDFYNGEVVRYLGFVTDPEVMATYYRTANHFLYTYFMDCCSNTLIEAILCLCPIEYLELSGGALEIKKKHNTLGCDYFKLPRMKEEYKEAFEFLS